MNKKLETIDGGKRKEDVIEKLKIVCDQ